MCFATGAAAATVAAGDHTTLATLAGRCTKATVMNVETDPNLCSNKVTNIKLRSGQLGYAFQLHPQSDLGPFVVSFVGSKPRHIKRHKAQVLPVHRVFVSFDGRTDDLVAIGSCEVRDSGKGSPAKVSCSANTVEGNFVGEFVATDRNVSPSTILTDRQLGRRVNTHSIVCGQPTMDGDGSRRHETDDCYDSGRQ